jgi:hypothetical protein
LYIFIEQESIGAARGIHFGPDGMSEEFCACVVLVFIGWEAGRFCATQENIPTFLSVIMTIAHCRWTGFRA